MFRWPLAAPETVAQLRAFNRFATRFARALERRYLGTPFTLLEARLLWEVHGTPGVTAQGLERRMGIDQGQMSRLVGRMEGRGLLVRRPSAEDARRREVRLTEDGREAFEDLDGRAQEQATDFVDRLAADEQDRLIGALAELRTLLGEEPWPVRLRGAQEGDLGWTFMRQAEVYRDEHGYAPVFERYVCQGLLPYLEHHDLARDRMWIAERGGARVGSIAIQHDPERPGWAKLRWYLVERPARGQGIGAMLLAQAIHFCLDADYEGVHLWTCSDLAAARRQYEKVGFRPVEEAPCPWKDGIVQQRWELRL